MSGLINVVEFFMWDLTCDTAILMKMSMEPKSLPASFALRSCVKMIIIWSGVTITIGFFLFSVESLVDLACCSVLELQGKEGGGLCISRCLSH